VALTNTAHPTQKDMKYYAEGIMLNLNNFSDEQNVVDKCLNGNNCIINILVGIVCNEKICKLKVMATSENEIFEDIIITAIRIYNAPIT
jgi:hypothetical protein